MLQEVKFPNKHNQCASFCNSSGCRLQKDCAFGFNRIFMGARELRIDFNQCNLKCVLCWSNNNDSNRIFSVDEIFQSFATCMESNYNYIYNIKKPDKPETFKLQSLQVIGGEPFLDKNRFKFVLSFLHKLDSYILENLDYCYSVLKVNAQKRFKVKLFTNGVTIGNGAIDVSDIKLLSDLKNINTELLISLKGLHENGFNALQSDCFNANDCFEHQIICLEKLLNEYDKKKLHIQPVLGFYHSEHFNIETQSIKASNMFVFDDTPLSKRLHDILKKYISKGYGFYVEPIHAVGKTNKDIQVFYKANTSLLNYFDLVEANLKSNRKTDYKKTKLKDLF